MLKYTFVLAALALSACGATPQEEAGSIQLVQSNLPAGCVLSHAGDVMVTGSSRESRIFVVQCKDVVTISESHEVQEGKTSHMQNDVIVSKN